MDCNKCCQSLPILDELEEQAAEEVVMHVNTCPVCRREAEEYAFLFGILGSMRDLNDCAFNGEQFAAATQQAALDARARVLGSQRVGRHRWAMRFAAASMFLFVSLALLFTALADQEPGRETGRPLTVIAAGQVTEQPAEAERMVIIDGPLGPAAEGLETLKPAMPEEVTDLEPAVTEAISIRPGGAGTARTAAVSVWLGVLFQNRGDSKVVIDRIIEGGPAAHAGMRPGDIVLRCNGIEVENKYALRRIITRLGPGRVVTLTVARGERFLRIITLTARDPIL